MENSVRSFEKAMVKIPAGEIQLRDDRINTIWKVDIEPFSLSKYPITQSQYFLITGQKPSSFTGDHLPVETVSWKDAVSFCNALSRKASLEPCYAFSTNSESVVFNQRAEGYRLPTEAEWEYACKANINSIRYGKIEDIAWYKSNSEKSTHIVGEKLPNDWGLFDMLGNVWEWCSDIYDETVYGSYRIFRGGGWYDEERGVMATNRRRSHPLKFKIDDLGFRVARNLVK